MRVASIDDKLRERILKWLGHVLHRSKETHIHESDVILIEHDI